MATEKTIQTAFRLPESLIKELDELAAEMSTREMTYTRADVLRMAASRGLEEIKSNRRKKR